jgi:hypothetical protein
MTSEMIVRSDWDLSQLFTNDARCLEGMISQQLASTYYNRKPELVDCTNDFIPNGQIVKLTLPVVSQEFVQTGTGPQYLLIQTPTDRDRMMGFF